MCGTANPIAGTASTTCPVCGRSFTPDLLPAHAATCGGGGGDQAAAGSPEHFMMLTGSDAATAAVWINGASGRGLKFEVCS
jgi:hypothetical protein